MFHKNSQLKNLTYDYFNKCSTNTPDSCGKVIARRVAPKKVVLSKNLNRVAIQDGKSCPAIIHEEKHKNDRINKKTTKSVANISEKWKGNPLDYCKTCGDIKTCNKRTEHPHIAQKNKAQKVKRNTSNSGRTSKSVKQYYKNENFRPSTDSMREIENGMKKLSLDTIREVSTTKTSSNVIHVCHDEEIGYYDTENVDNLKELKQFRDNNYFECHSAKSRIENKLSVTSLKNHKCTYRFYLNDRLFPVPVSTDHHDNIRCVECHLPLNLTKDESQTANGTIQAKIKIGKDDPQDTVLFLPVNDQLIMKQRRKEPKKDEEICYFGIIKLSSDGNSLFNQTLPTDSFALKYQKGYKEYHQQKPYRFENVDEDNVVII